MMVEPNAYIADDFNFSDLAVLAPTIFDELSEIICIKRPDQTILFCNRIGYESFNCSPEIAIGKKCNEIFDCKDKCESCPTTLAVKLKKMTRVETFFATVGKWFEIVVIPVFNKKNEIIYVIEIMREITHIKKLQAELSKR